MKVICSIGTGPFRTAERLVKSTLLNVYVPISRCGDDTVSNATKSTSLNVVPVATAWSNVGLSLSTTLTSVTCVTPGESDTTDSGSLTMPGCKIIV